VSTNFVDPSTNTSVLTDDYFLDNSNKAARGAVVRVFDNTTSTATEHDLADANPACVTVSMDTTHTYNLRLYAKANLNGNLIRVWNNDTDNDIWVYQGETNWQPPLNVISKTLTTGSHAAWNILAAAGWAMHRRTGGLSGETITIYTQTCPGSSSGISCYNAPNQSLYIDPIADELKYVVVHEMGHNVARLRDAGQIPNKTALASPDGNCQASDGPMIQKRYTSLAADEGLAWYYSVVAFNNTNETNCDFVRLGHDWDQDGLSVEFGQPPNDEQSPSCQGEVGEGWAVWNYIDNECGGTLEDSGTYFDWMRAFWDMDAIHGVSTTAIFDLWVEADPSTWDADGGSGCDPVDEDPCDPQERLDNASVRLGIDSEWGLAAGFNGVH
jgi:hypothetical protein